MPLTGHQRDMLIRLYQAYLVDPPGWITPSRRPHRRMLRNLQIADLVVVSQVSGWCIAITGRGRRIIQPYITRLEEMEALHQQVVELARTGQTYAEIGQQIGYSESNVAAIAVRALGKRIRPKTSASADEILSLLDQGLQYADIAERVRCSVAHVGNVARANTVTNIRTRAQTRRQQARRLHAQGTSVPAIASYLGVSPASVYLYIKD